MSTLTPNDRLDIELRNKSNPDVARLLRYISDDVPIIEKRNEDLREFAALVRTEIEYLRDYCNRHPQPEFIKALLKDFDAAVDKYSDVLPHVVI
jgi:hypothetical protein